MAARRVSAVPSRAPSAAGGGAPVFITPVSRMGHCLHVSYSGTLRLSVSRGWSWRCWSATPAPPGYRRPGVSPTAVIEILRTHNPYPRHGVQADENGIPRYTDLPGSLIAMLAR